MPVLALVVPLLRSETFSCRGGRRRRFASRLVDVVLGHVDNRRCRHRGRCRWSARRFAECTGSKRSLARTPDGSQPATPSPRCLVEVGTGLPHSRASGNVVMGVDLRRRRCGCRSAACRKIKCRALCPTRSCASAATRSRRVPPPSCADHLLWLRRSLRRPSWRRLCARPRAGLSWRLPSLARASRACGPREGECDGTRPRQSLAGLRDVRPGGCAAAKGEERPRRGTELLGASRNRGQRKGGGSTPAPDVQH